MLWVIVLVVLVIILIWAYSQEGFRSCRCSKPAWVSPNGSIIVNPFLYPSSGMMCTDGLYAANKDVVAPLTHLNTPDHEILTN